jgi:ribonuclease inhibitor
MWKQKNMDYNIDISNVNTRKEFHEAVRRVLPCPEYYGNNLDALHDVLTDNFPEGKIFFTGCRNFMELFPDYYKSLVKMCEDITADNPLVEMIFID